MEKLDFSAKIGNISETEQDKNIVCIECLYKAVCGFSVGTKINDLE